MWLLAWMLMRGHAVLEACLLRGKIIRRIVCTAVAETLLFK